MKNKTISPAELKSRFQSWRKARHFGTVAILSVSAMRTAQTLDDADASRQIRRIVSSRMHDRSAEESGPHGIDRTNGAPEMTRKSPAAGYRLSRSERTEIATVRPGARSVVYRRPAKPPTEDPLPVGFVAAPAEDYAPLLIRDAEIEAQAAREAQEEIADLDRSAAAVSFESDYSGPFPVDYTPSVPEVLATVRNDAQEDSKIASATIAPAESEFDALRRAVLAMAS